MGSARRFVNEGFQYDRNKERGTLHGYTDQGPISSRFTAHSDIWYEDEPTPLELYIRKRFNTMANRVQDERRKINKLLKQYEEKHLSEQYEEKFSSLPSRRKVDTERQEYGTNDDIESFVGSDEYIQPTSDFERQRRRSSQNVEHPRSFKSSTQWSDEESVEEKAPEPIQRRDARPKSSVQPGSTEGEKAQTNATQVTGKSRPRYQAPTASSRRRWLEQELENRESLLRDIPAHQEVYPVPLHLAARLGIPSL